MNFVKDYYKHSARNDSNATHLPYRIWSHLNKKGLLKSNAEHSIEITEGSMTGVSGTLNITTHNEDIFFLDIGIEYISLEIKLDYSKTSIDYFPTDDEGQPTGLVSPTSMRWRFSKGYSLAASMECSDARQGYTRSRGVDEVTPRQNVNLLLEMLTMLDGKTPNTPYTQGSIKSGAYEINRSFGSTTNLLVS